MSNFEYTLVEKPFIEQLQAMGWQYLPGDVGIPYLTERQSFREVLLYDRLKAALKKLNPDAVSGQPWLDDTRIQEAIGQLERFEFNRLPEINRHVSDLLLRGAVVAGDPEPDPKRNHNGHNRDFIARYIDFDNPANNDFLVINQFRVDVPGSERGKIIPDIVLFVNGIPLVVVECKSPYVTDPLEEAINQLLRYSNQRGYTTLSGRGEGVERLFWYNQLMLVSSGDKARAGTIGARAEHYLEWKDTAPVPTANIIAELGLLPESPLTGQQLLVAGMLRPAHLLDITRNFVLYQESGSRTVKIVARYQQFRAVQAAIHRLITGKTKLQDGEFDKRGGIIWHTQGSGKSLTMVFLVKKMRTLPQLRRFKIVVVTDRTDLEKQLTATAALTGDVIQSARNTEELKTILRREGTGLVFAMIQKYREGDDSQSSASGEKSSQLPAADEIFPILNEDEAILVLVDEAHRSHTSTLHANLDRALPNSARIGFTGTPILTGDRQYTTNIFGSFIDRYTIHQAEADGSTVPILYEGIAAEAEVSDGRSLDKLFEDAFADKTPQEREAIKKRYATESAVLEAEELISAKAEDILRHYVDNILPDGFKAQLVAVSRRAAVRYQVALERARDKLAAELEALPPAILSLSAEELEKQPRSIQRLVRAYPQLALIKKLEFAAVISGSNSDDPAWKKWTANPERHISEFKKPFSAPDPANQSSLAFLIVKSMLLTGFDAPIEQVLYLDRKLRDYELLQAIARVNRTANGKKYGLVVDYYGIGQHLKDALAVYNAEDVAGALTSLKDELPRLSDAHYAVVQLFKDRGQADLTDIEACVTLLADVQLRASFKKLLQEFLQVLNIVLPRAEALPYVPDARRLGLINERAKKRYRDEELDILGAGEKVRDLIDTYIIANGIDPKVPPINILDAEFEQAVNANTSDRAKASEMEHAVRYHLTVYFQEDPVYFKRLSERLDDILSRLAGNWAELIAALQGVIREIREGQVDNSLEARFLRLLVEEVQAAEGSSGRRGNETSNSSTGTIDKERLARLAGQVVSMLQIIRNYVRLVDFWRPSRINRQNELRGELIQFLDNNDLIPFEKQEAVADKLVELAKYNHERLVASV